MNNIEFEDSYLTWLLSQQNREDSVGLYARTAFADFEAGNEFHLIDSTISENPSHWKMYLVTDFCHAKGVPNEDASLLLLGNAMAVMEFNVGLMTGAIPRVAMTDGEADVARNIIAHASDLISAILQDMHSDGKDI